ncbi:MAG: selenide, water dikinase SelD, partial [Moorea sp. SIO3C2]|nr:selenide, water dikinase SelD [Moorena sp. SIO3C2]
FPPCSGCASKVGKSVLDKVLNQFRTTDSTVLIGLDTADDAAVVQVPPGMALVQTVDYFRALLDDPFLVGQITAHHCLNDLYAMGASPHSAMAIASLPYAIPSKQENTLYLLLSGVVKVLTGAGAELIGGHTVEGTELGLGLSCNGLAVPEQLWRKGGMQPGDQLILTKALGTGTLFAADMQLRAKGRWIEGAIASMLQSNQPAVECLRQHGATACTDVTGFGLAGHLLEMVTASNQSVDLRLETIQALPGAIATLEQGFFSSLYPENRKAGRGISMEPAVQNHSLYPLLFDPQTSGGLLASVPKSQGTACVSPLQSLGYRSTQIIGHVEGKIHPGDVRPMLYLG